MRRGIPSAPSWYCGMNVSVKPTIQRHEMEPADRSARNRPVIFGNQ